MLHSAVGDPRSKHDRASSRRGTKEKDTNVKSRDGEEKHGSAAGLYALYHKIVNKRTILGSSLYTLVAGQL